METSSYRVLSTTGDVRDSERQSALFARIFESSKSADTLSLQRHVDSSLAKGGRANSVSQRRYLPRIDIFLYGRQTVIQRHQESRSRDVYELSCSRSQHSQRTHRLPNPLKALVPGSFSASRWRSIQLCYFRPFYYLCMSDSSKAYR